MKINLAVIMLISCFVSGCMVRHSEVQHFKTAGNPPNYFKLTVKSSGYFTKAKYSSGFYDEKALDIYLNEFGSKNYVKSGQTGSASLSSGGTTTETNTADAAPSGNESNEPLNSNGVYAYIFSTNADDIARTIGAFAESQVTADNINALLNKERLSTLAEKENTLKQKVNAVPSVRMELEGLVSQITNTPGPAARPDLKNYVYVLNAVARGLGLQANFKNIDEAKSFFDAVQ